MVADFREHSSADATPCPMLFRDTLIFGSFGLNAAKYTPSKYCRNLSGKSGVKSAGSVEAVLVALAERPFCVACAVGSDCFWCDRISPSMRGYKIAVVLM